MLAVPDVCEGLQGSLVAARAPADARFRRAVIDSRLAASGDLFFALRGERLDGHDFVTNALAAGAAGAVVERPVDAPEHAAVFHVSDSLKALQRLASYWRRRHNVRVVGVTGSVGKTTCKEVIASVLSHRYRLLKSEANLNTEIGIPLTLLQLTAAHERAVLEMAMYRRGDISLLADIAQPHVGVVTNIGPVHLERVGYMGGIVAAKAELVEALPAAGLAVLNGDDPRVAALSRRTQARTVYFGLSPQCHVRAQNIVSRGLEGIEFRITYGESSVEVRCPLPGRHHAYPALAAAAVALNDGMTLDEVAEALAEVRPDLRLRVLPGPNGSTIIDDTYNASPASMLAALDLLSELPGRRIAVLGEMRELGAAEESGNAAVGERAASACDLLYVFGERARPIGEAAVRAGHPRVRYPRSIEEAADALREDLGRGDHALIKASRAVGLEALVHELAVTG
jgi:UDP-N-acetylmuramoyl-tripeptide--D-alanyl-D-alanine ligase